jgi:hypothetical protein
LPPAIDGAHARKTTITDTERAAFEKLYKTFNTQGQGRPKDKIGEHEELDQIADEYYEDDEDRSGNTLDKAFDAVLQGSARAQQLQRGANRLASRTKQSAESATGNQGLSAVGVETPQSKTQLAMKADREKVKKLRLEERDRVDKLLKNAHTDHQLWQVLDREVFDQLRRLDLDGAGAKTAVLKKTADATQTPAVGKGRSKSSSPEDKRKDSQAALVDKRILFPNYPHHLLSALTSLRTNFPSSPLPLTILSTIKSLGRSSYALGTTPLLYRHLLRTAWLQQSSYTLVDNLLTDMETNVVEFDIGILEVLDAIIKEYEMARSGRLGREMQLVYGMEMWGEDAKKIKVWRNVVAERLGVKDEIAASGIQWMERRSKNGTRRGDVASENRDREHVPLVEGTNGPPDSKGESSKAKITTDEIPFVDGGYVKIGSDAVGEEANEGLPDNGNQGGDAELPVKVLL